MSVFRFAPCLAVMLPFAAEAADMAGKRPAPFDRCAAVEAPAGVAKVPGGDLFGFTSGTDIGDPCSWAFGSEHSMRAGRADGSYFALSSKSSVAYTFNDRFALAASLFTSLTNWQNVTVAQNAAPFAVTGVNSFQFDGGSFETTFRILKRSAGNPFAVTLSMEPRWSRVDGLTGLRADGYGVEFKLFTDVALSSRLFAAVNLNYALGTARFADVAGAAWTDSSTTNLSTALTYQLYQGDGAVEGVYVGGELRYNNSFSGAVLNQHLGYAIYGGPTVAVAFAGGYMLNAVVLPQLAGSARTPTLPGRLDLDNFDGAQFRIKLTGPLGFLPKI